jgi:hypothetical protein
MEEPDFFKKYAKSNSSENLANPYGQKERTKSMVQRAKMKPGSEITHDVIGKHLRQFFRTKNSND